MLLSPFPPSLSSRFASSVWLFRPELSAALVANPSAAASRVVPLDAGKQGKATLHVSWEKNGGTISAEAAHAQLRGCGSGGIASVSFGSFGGNTAGEALGSCRVAHHSGNRSVLDSYRDLVADACRHMTDVCTISAVTWYSWWISANHLNLPGQSYSFDSKTGLVWLRNDEGRPVPL